MIVPLFLLRTLFHTVLNLGLFLSPNYTQITEEQQLKIKELISKYNDILLNSMRLAIAEDFVNLVILNRDDEDIELRQLLENKNEYYNYILKEFLKKNSSSVVDELKSMDEPTIQLKRKVRASKD